MLWSGHAAGSFLVETAQAEIARRKSLQLLTSDPPAWKDGDHPELAEGSSAWVRSLRQEGERHIPVEDTIENCPA